MCEAYAGVLADLASAVRRDGFVMALRDERRPVKKAALERLTAPSSPAGGGKVGGGGGGAVAVCLIAPLVHAAVAGKRQVWHV